MGLVGIQWKFLTSQRWKVKFPGATGLRSPKSHILLTPRQRKPLSVLKQRRTYRKRQGLAPGSYPGWMLHMLLPSERPAGTPEVGVVRKHTPTRAVLQPQKHADPSWQWATVSWRETCLSLFTGDYLGPFLHVTQPGCFPSKVRETQFTPCPGESPSGSNTALRTHWTLLTGTTRLGGWRLLFWPTPPSRGPIRALTASFRDTGAHLWLWGEQGKMAWPHPGPLWLQCQI